MNKLGGDEDIMILMETDYSTTGGFTMRHGRNGVCFFLSISIPKGGGGCFFDCFNIDI